MCLHPNPNGTAKAAYTVPQEQSMGNTPGKLAPLDDQAKDSSDTSTARQNPNCTLSRASMAPPRTPHLRPSPLAEQSPKKVPPSSIHSNPSRETRAKRKAADHDQEATAKRSEKMQEHPDEMANTPHFPFAQHSNGPAATMSYPPQLPDRYSMGPSFIGNFTPVGNFDSSARQVGSDYAGSSAAPWQPADDAFRISPRPHYGTDRSSPSLIFNGHLRDDYIGTPAAFSSKNIPSSSRPCQYNDNLEIVDVDAFHASQRDVITSQTDSGLHKHPSVFTGEPKSDVEPKRNAAANDRLSSIFLNIYLDDAAATDDPLGCITLEDLDTKDKLFAEVQAILEDELAADDTISMIRIKRADGEVFQGPNVLTMPITRAGMKDTWNALVQKIWEHGVGDGGLRGYVKVKRGAGSK